jgi:hypothetical protein
MAPPTTRSSPAPDPIFQVINDCLQTITEDLNNIHQDVMDLKTNTTGFKTEFPHHLEHIDERINTTIISDPMMFTPTILSNVN